MWKRIFELLFGAKLPCGHCRVRAKLGNRVTCPKCGNGYQRVKFANRIDWPYVDECLSDMKNLVDTDRKATPELMDKMADKRFVSFLEHSVAMMEAAND